MTPRSRAATLVQRAIALAVSIAIVGCSAVRPKPLTDDEVRARVRTDQPLIYAEQEPITAPIGLDTAIARALKYNLDYRLKLMERALAEGQLDVSRFDMLPRLVASAGYTSRNNEAGGTSVGIEDRQVSLRPSTSVERSRYLVNAEFSWNVLDFGLSYYRSKQLADESLMAEERRRRVMQNIVQDVRTAYWRALGSQRLAVKSDQLLARVREALERSREAESRGLLPPSQALAYQRALLDATTLLNIRRQELEFSKRELSALMNVTPGTEFTLASETEPVLPGVPRNVGELEEIALAKRPELREEDYRKRVSIAETRRALISLLPGISIDFSGNYDSNKFLYNQAWAEGGLRVFSNLMRLPAIPAINRTNEARLRTDDARRTALSMAVITQVRVALQRYELALVDVDIAEESSRVDERLAQYARAAVSSKTDSDLEVVRTEARVLIAQFQRSASFANAQAAYGRILNSVGVDLIPDRVEKDDVATLATAVSKQIAEAERDTFPPVTRPVRPAHPLLRLDLENIDDPAIAGAARDAITRALQRGGFEIKADDPAAWPLRMRLELAAAREGLRRGEWRMALSRPDGSAAGETRYGSAFASQVIPSTVSAFSEAAVISQLRLLENWVRVDPR